MRYSLLTHLECSACQHPWDAGQLRNTCPDCQAPLLARYDLETVRSELRREEFADRPRGMQRWHELLPVQSPEAVVTLGEGDTPLLDMPALGGELGLTNLTLKDESLNPTGTFKARGQATAISRAKELGARQVIIPTAGNAGGATVVRVTGGGWVPQAVNSRKTIKIRPVHLFITPSSAQKHPAFIIYGRARGERAKCHVLIVAVLMSC